jgi:hypothetical protein
LPKYGASSLDAAISVASEPTPAMKTTALSRPSGTALPAVATTG